MVWAKVLRAVGAQEALAWCTGGRGALVWATVSFADGAGAQVSVAHGNRWRLKPVALRGGCASALRPVASFKQHAPLRDRYDTAHTEASQDGRAVCSSSRSRTGASPRR